MKKTKQDRWTVYIKRGTYPFCETQELGIIHAACLMDASKKAHDIKEAVYPVLAKGEALKVMPGIFVCDIINC